MSEPGATPSTKSSHHHRAIEAVWKIESPHLIAALVRTVRDVHRAEELAQDAFLAALTQWPESGIPDNPGAWLMTAAKRRAVDHTRRDRRARDIHEQLAHQADAAFLPAETVAADTRLDRSGEDDLLRLIFMTCHPALSREARAALALRLLCSLTTGEIARAFLVPEPTIAQRIVRAKRTLAEYRDAFDLPAPRERADRLASVLEVLYLLFNEGYAATAGDDWMRPALCEEAVRLGRVLVGLAPRDSEVHGLVALMELQSSRTAARTAPDGTPILLLEQNRARWDHLLIRRGLAALDSARALTTPDNRGPYLLQAEIAACHARAHQAADTDWPAIVRHYTDLLALYPSPIIALNRAVAVSMADGPAAALPLIEAISTDPTLAHSHLLPAARADLLSKLGRLEEARAEFQRAAERAQNGRERTLLQQRAEACRQA